MSPAKLLAGQIHEALRKRYHAVPLPRMPVRPGAYWWQRSRRIVVLLHGGLRDELTVEEAQNYLRWLDEGHEPERWLEREDRP